MVLAERARELHLPKTRTEGGPQQIRPTRKQRFAQLVRRTRRDWRILTIVPPEPGPRLQPQHTAEMENVLAAMSSRAAIDVSRFQNRFLHEWLGVEPRASPQTLRRLWGLFAPPQPLGLGFETTSSASARHGQ